MTDKQGNQWAWLTNMSVEGSAYEYSMLEFTGKAPATPEIMQVVNRWFRSGGQFPIYREEWFCLYCTSPNQLPLTHCAKCGAPRNWFIG